jgi:Apea-like HEPN
MKKVSYVTCFRKLKLTQQITGSLELLPGVNISNDPIEKARFLTPECARAVGAIEMTHLGEESNLIVGEFDLEDMKGMPPEPFLVVILAWLDMLLRNAWLIKDHAIECDAAFLRVEIPSGISWTKNFLAVRPSLANGYTQNHIEMNNSELKKWTEMNDLVEMYLHDANSSSLRFMMEKGYARSGRAMQFVVAARRAQDLAFKIANYCSALETLFTTESTELAHKLAERVAFFLADKGFNRRAVYTTVKLAYGIRSKLVHGDTLKPSQVNGLPALSVECDVFVRTILLAIFSSPGLQQVFDSQNDAIEDHFAKLIFGPREHS